ncbi:MAG TPA: hypothetical protein VN478_00405 [Clostridia bacterium]|nr:hypothetical protein [Clostridia bacterium]
MGSHQKYRMGRGEKIFLWGVGTLVVLGIISSLTIPYLLRQRERARDKTADTVVATSGMPATTPTAQTGTPSETPQGEPAQFDEKAWLERTRAKLNECKRLLTSPDLYKDSYDLAANNIASAKVLTSALCTGTIPAKTPQVEALSSSLARGFVARLEAEIWLREHDPSFKTYANRLDIGLKPEFDEYHLLYAIDDLDYGKAVEKLNQTQIRPSEINTSQDAYKKWLDQSQRVSANQNLVMRVAPEKLLVYFRLSHDNKPADLRTEISDQELIDHNEDSTD